MIKFFKDLSEQSGNLLWIPYCICGGAIVLAGVLFYFLHCQKVLRLLGEKNDGIQDKREEHSVKTLIPFFFTVFFQYFASQSIETVFNTQVNF